MGFYQGLESEEEKVNREPRRKRSDAMRALLFEKGIVVDDDNMIAGYEGFEFLINGRIRTSEGDTISTVQFVKDYV